MKRQIVSIVLIVALWLCALSTAAYADSQANVTVNAIAGARPGDVVTVSGAADFAEVLVKVMRPDQTVLYVDVVPVGADRRYATAIKLPSNALIGTYTIAAGRGANVATTRMEVAAKEGPSTGAGIRPDAPSVKIGRNGKLIVAELAPSALHADWVTKDDRVVAKIAVDGSKLTDAFAAFKAQSGTGADGAVKVVALKVNGAADSIVVELPIAALAKGKETASDAIVAIQSESAFYRLPVRIPDYSELARQVGGSIEEASIRIAIDKLQADTDSRAAAAIRKLGATPLSGVVDFTVTVAFDGKETAADLGDAYTERGFYLAEPAASDGATAVIVRPDTGAILFAPALFEEAEDGRTEVVIKRIGNGSHAVLAYAKTFDDLPPGHWARKAVHALANKLLVNGVDESRFAPEDAVTRAEFTALLVRALGLTPDGTAGMTLTDVGAADWFADAVGTALNAKLATGYEDGTFRPDASISREEMAVMIDAALQIAGQPADRSPSASAELPLSRYKDANRVSE